jgi:CheY-like chemotaxis protein
MTIKKYTVSLDGLLSHENIIFKLICSVSERTKDRTKSYTLSTETQDSDIYINDIKNKQSNDVRALNHIHVWVADDKESSENTITRPLIATRVLHILDNLVENIEPVIINNTNDKINIVSNSDEQSITEEEASELAIVHDEMLENPANKDEISSTNNIELMLVKNQENKSLSNGGTHHVLVVDDSQSVRKQLEIELEYFDVSVDFADSAESAFALIDSNFYDLALLDVVLPDKSGYQICKEIKSKNKNTIAIMLTGKATQADKIKGSLAGCDDYLIKPVGRITFQNAVKRFIHLKNTNTAIEA